MTLQNEDNTTSKASINTDANHELLIREITLPLYSSILWIRLFAASLIIYGAAITVTGVGVLIAWVPLWIGLLLFLLVKTLKTAYEQNSKDDLMRSLSRIKLIFTILGLVSVGLFVISLYLIYYAYEKSLF